MYMVLYIYILGVSNFVTIHLDFKKHTAVYKSVFEFVMGRWVDGHESSCCVVMRGRQRLLLKELSTTRSNGPCGEPSQQEPFERSQQVPFERSQQVPMSPSKGSC